MQNLIIYSYPKCSTCRKAVNWLDQKNIGYKLFDIVKEKPSLENLDLALKQFSEDKSKIFNTRGKKFKLIDFDINSLSNEEIIQLLSSDGKLIKRPFLIYEEKKIILGFNENVYAKCLIKS